MLKISRLADYSSVIMHFLAAHPDNLYSAKTVATELHMPLPTVSKVLKLLNEAGLLSSTRGVNGGYQLARPSSDISVAAIITAIDGKPAVTQCCDEADTCDLAHNCELRGNWQLINQVVLDVLNSLSLHDMQSPLTRDFPIHFHSLDRVKAAKVQTQLAETREGKLHE